MSNLNVGISSCRHCQHYRAEGRRGGHCQQLGAQVQSSWKACYLAVPPFSPTWEGLEGIMAWQDEIIHAADKVATEYDLSSY